MRPARLAVRFAALGFVMTLAGATYAQIPSVPSVPSVPTVPTVPTVPSAPTMPSAPQNPLPETTSKEKPNPARSDVANDGTVGSALNHLLDGVNLGVTQAAAAGNWQAMEAGRDLAIAISSTQNVYEEDLGKKVDSKIPVALKSSIDQLQNAVTQLGQLSKASVEVAQTDAEQVRNSLPYKPAEPKLVKFAPRFLVPAHEAYLVKFHLNGTFELAPKAEFEPTLLMKEHTYKPVNTTATDIEFDLPVSDLFPATASAKKLQFIVGTLKMPWETSSLMGKHHTKKEDSFKLVLPALPASPGTIKFMSSSTRLEAGPTQRHTGIPMYQCSGRGCGGDDINHVWTEKPDTNCTVVPGSSAFNQGTATGDVQHQFLGDAGEGVSYSVSTTKRGTGTSKVNFTIDFSETCGKEVANNIGEVVPMSWGESKTIPITNGSWKVSLDTFDGMHSDYTKDGTNSMLTVTSTPDGVTLKTADPQTFVFPPAGP